MKKHFTWLLLLCAIFPQIAYTQEKECAPLPKTGCNYIRNHTFFQTPPQNCTEAFDAFSQGNVPNWRPFSGSPDVNPAWTTVTPPSSPVSNFAYMFTGQKQTLYYGVIPYIYDLQAESIIQQIPQLEKGKRYSLSYFLQHADVNPSGVIQVSNQFGCGYGASPTWQNGNSVDKFNIILMHCKDVPPGPAPYGLPAVPVNAQPVVCQYNIANNSWEQYHSEFTADDDYDMILVYPEPTQYHTPENPNMISGGGQYSNAVAFAHPEIIAVDDIRIEMGGVSNEKCEVTLNIHCNITNADVKWYDPNGNGISNGNSVVVNGQNTGMYYAEIYSPGAANNNTCSDNNPLYKLFYDLQPQASTQLQIVNSYVAYDYHADGINTFDNGEDKLVLETTKCGFNYHELCKFTDEGKLEFHLESSEPSGNEWEIYRDGFLIQPNIPNYNPATTVYTSGTGNFSQQFDPAVNYIGFNAPTVFEIRLKNTVLNEQQSIFLKLKPQAYVTMSTCYVGTGNWLSTELSAYYVNAGTQFLWENLPAGLVSTLATNNMDLTFDPSTIAQQTMVTVRTLGSDYGCERLLYVNIAPNTWGCNRTPAANHAANNDVKKKPEVYPNPANGLVHIRLDGLKQVQLFDISGRLVMNKYAYREKGMQLDVSGIGKGIYLVKVTDNTGKVQSSKLVIQ